MACIIDAKFIMLPMQTLGLATNFSDEYQPCLSVATPSGKQLLYYALEIGILKLGSATGTVRQLFFRSDLHRLYRTRQPRYRKLCDHLHHHRRVFGFDLTESNGYSCDQDTVQPLVASFLNREGIHTVYYKGGEFERELVETLSHGNARIINLEWSPHHVCKAQYICVPDNLRALIKCPLHTGTDATAHCATRDVLAYYHHAHTNQPTDSSPFWVEIAKLLYRTTV